MGEKANTRKYIRFGPDAGDFVQIDKNLNQQEFEFQDAALLVDESMGGFSVVCLRSVGLTVGATYRVKVGRIAPLKAELLWEKELDDKVLRMGFRFIDVK